VETVSAVDPVLADDGVRAAIDEAGKRIGMPPLALPSGAGHDAAQMSALGPMGMIFVPSRDGRSHCPEEWTELDAIVEGVRCLAMTLLILDRELGQHADRDGAILSI
jgi:N-carbamoyl-L-amino-acid hydrolase